MLYKRLIWLKKISFTDCGRHHWPEKSIEGGGSLPKVSGENIRPGQCQPYDRPDQFKLGPVKSVTVRSSFVVVDGLHVVHFGC